MINFNTIRLIIFIVVFMLISFPTVSAQKGSYLNLDFKNKQSFKVYVAGPVDAKKGILIIHGWWGLTKVIENYTNEFADAGYRAMAIDIYNGEVTDDPKVAKNMMTSVKQEEADAKYVAALNALKAKGRKLATLGWSYGATQALYATLSAPELVAATVSYYPFKEMISDKNRLAPMKGPILIQVGDKDFAFTPDKAKKYAVSIKNAGKVLKINTYDAKHGFSNPESKTYNRNVKDLADKSTLKFLDEYLK